MHEYMYTPNDLLEYWTFIIYNPLLAALNDLNAYVFGDTINVLPCTAHTNPVITKPLQFKLRYEFEKLSLWFLCSQHDLR